MVDGVVDIPLRGKTLVTAAVDAGASRGQVRRRDTAHDHFLAGPENRLVEVAVRAVVEGRPNGYNPLVLYGPSGTGKSHLAHGLAEVWRSQAGRGTTDLAVAMVARSGDRPQQSGDGTQQSGNRVQQSDRVQQRLGRESGRNREAMMARSGDRPQQSGRVRRRVACITAVDFARELTDAIETQAVDEFRAKYRGAAMLVIEDLGQLATPRSGKLSAQEELIHTLDALVGAGRWVVVTSSAPPWELPGIVPMLQSRLSGGLAVRLSPPGPETRLALLQRLASQRDIELPESVAQLLADGLTGTARELAGALLNLAIGGDPLGGPTGQEGASGSRALDLTAARQYLAGGRREREPTLHEIALATARHFSLRLSELKSSSRRRALVAARGVAVCLARDAGGHRLEEIGRYFGGRDHTTVLHNYRTTKELIATEPATRTAFEQLRSALWKT
ncbi:MAG: hypothetical protein LLG00_08355 [Planctomycetaceae bacterium]|nr:hypothetical protein [Planctomycetaceae bacterium]